MDTYHLVNGYKELFASVKGKTLEQVTKYMM